MNRDEQALKNLDLVEAFLHDIIDEPSILDEIKQGSTIVLLPSDDTELEQANLEMARAMVQSHRAHGAVAGADHEAQAGRGVYLKSVS